MWGLFLWCGARLFAQDALFSEVDGRAYPVVQAQGALPYVRIGDKLVRSDERRLALRKVDEYRPVFVAIRGIRVNHTGRNWKGHVINNEFHFWAEFETPYRLDDVFLVLEMHTGRAGNLLFLHEVGRLDPRGIKTIKLTVPLSEPLGPGGRYKIHLFAGGEEVLHSQMPEEHRESVVDRMIAQRIAAVPDADPRPFEGPAPEYPPPLLKAKTTGQAVISLHVGANGRIADPVVKSATDPAFGEAALAAVRLWRFLPRVKDGHPVETQVDLPFDFAPPTRTGEAP